MIFKFIFVWATVAVCCAATLSASDQCVNHGGTGGCKSSINTAIAAAGIHDTVTVAGGVYSENVIINKSLSLIGSGAVINAAGLANGQRARLEY
jgi:pectin methylesterase-like acyl-CoA thioesterase